MEEEEVARKVAKILGPSSAAAKALARYDELKAQGLPTAIFRADGAWFVYEPPPASEGAP